MPLGTQFLLPVADSILLLQFYIKAGAGEKGFGPLSIGFIFDKTIDV